MEVCEKGIERDTYTFVKDLKRVVFKSYIISLYTCIDTTYTFVCVCVYEIVKNNKIEKGLNTLSSSFC